MKVGFSHSALWCKQVFPKCKCYTPIWISKSTLMYIHHSSKVTYVLQSRNFVSFTYNVSTKTTLKYKLFQVYEQKLLAMACLGGNHMLDILSSSFGKGLHMIDFVPSQC